jgi:glycosyltransferase involved in cell wall biosynthesis
MQLQLSIIIPVYNSKVLPKLVDEIIVNVKPHTYEIILVDDGNSSQVHEIIMRICAGNKQVKALQLS